MFSELQQAAYHEAAHVFAFLHFGIPFHAVYLAADDGTIVLSDGTVKDDAGGTVETSHDHNIYDWITPEVEDVRYLSIIVAGMCATKVMKPRSTYWQIVESGIAYTDYLQARRIAHIHRRLWAFEANDDACNDLMIYSVRCKVRRLVKMNWYTIVKIGDALIASPDRKLSYQQCCVLVGAECDRVAA